MFPKLSFIQNFILTLKELMRRYMDDKLPQVGGTLAYFFLLSIFPFFIFLNALLAFLNIPLGQIIRDLSHVAPREVVFLIEGYLNSIVRVRNTGLLSFGLLAALFSASRALKTLIAVLNTAYRTDETRNFLVVQLLSILLTLAMGLSIVTMLTFPILGRTIMTKIFDFFHLSIHFVETWVYLRWLIVFSILFITIALLYHVGPAARTPFRKAIPGTLFTSISWTLISLAFATYVNRFGRYSAVYGSIGAVIALMVWFYLTGILIMIGAELNQILYERHLSSKESNPTMSLSPLTEDDLDNRFEKMRDQFINIHSKKGEKES